MVVFILNRVFLALFGCKKWHEKTCPNIIITSFEVLESITQYGAGRNSFCTLSKMFSLIRFIFLRRYKISHVEALRHLISTQVNWCLSRVTSLEGSLIWIMKDNPQPNAQTNFLAQTMWVKTECVSSDMNRAGYVALKNNL